MLITLLGSEDDKDNNKGVNIGCGLKCADADMSHTLP